MLHSASLTASSYDFVDSVGTDVSKGTEKRILSHDRTDSFSAFITRNSKIPRISKDFLQEVFVALVYRLVNKRKDAENSVDMNNSMTASLYSCPSVNPEIHVLMRQRYFIYFAYRRQVRRNNLILRHTIQNIAYVECPARRILWIIIRARPVADRAVNDAPALAYAVTVYV